MLCRNKEKWPNTHSHQSVEESRRCWMGLAPLPAAPVAASSPPPVYQSPVRMATPAQVSYIVTLGGERAAASRLTMEEASAEIERRKAEKRAIRVEDPRLAMISGMLQMVPDGYYAVTPGGDVSHVVYLRFKHVDKATRKTPIGTLKIQYQASETWHEALVQWPQGNWSIYKRDVIESVMLVIADYRSAAKRFAREMQRCMRCSKKLTDDRSRHYLVGPECETKHGFTWPIREADEANNGLSFEDLVVRGMPTRVWQDTALV